MMRRYGTLRTLNPFVMLCALALVLALPSLFWRINWERANRSAVIVEDLDELRRFAAKEPLGSVTGLLLESGISGFAVPEYSAEDIRMGALPSVSCLPLASLPERQRQLFANPAGTVLWLEDPQQASRQIEFLARRFPDGEASQDGALWLFRVPWTVQDLGDSGLLPDLAAMESLSSAGVPMIYRPRPLRTGTVEDLLGGLEYLCDSFPSIKVLSPVSEVSAAFPQTVPLGDFIKKRGLLAAQLEFSSQIGNVQLLWSSWPSVASMHGVSAEEIVARKISRSTLLDRMFRAAHERSVRILLLRSDKFRSLPQSLTEYCSDVATIRARLDESGIGRLWPQPMDYRDSSVLAAVAMALLLLTLAARYSERFFAIKILSRWPLQLLTLSLFLGLLIWKVSLFAKLGGAFVTGLVATEAALLALDRWRAPLRGIPEGLLMVLAGGLTAAALFSTPIYMMRLRTFSGVKITLLLPLVLVLLLDLRRREHPESLSEILRRPPLWGELLLGGGLMLAALLMLVRSGNSGFVLSLETHVRQWLENALVARPRNKELLAGYPCLVLWYYLRRAQLWPHYREILRLGSTLAFSSAVNSFCHFHTVLSLTLLRVFNGWWAGLLVGSMALAALACLRWGWRRAAALQDSQ